jgi:CheY-specific phosphatase CheX
MYTEEEIRRITKAVWSIQLQLNLEDRYEDAEIDEEDELDAFGFGEEMTMTSSIHITGSWKGAVVFNSSKRLARRAASIMFDMAEHYLDDDQVFDALGELTSMTAGNLIGLISGQLTPSLPMVVEGTFHSMRLHGADIIREVELILDGEPLIVTIMEARPVDEEPDWLARRKTANK